MAATLPASTVRRLCQACAAPVDGGPKNVITLSAAKMPESASFAAETLIMASAAVGGGGHLAGAPVTAGSTTLNVVLPGRLSTRTEPPWAATTASTMDSPSPVDPGQERIQRDRRDHADHQTNRRQQREQRRDQPGTQRAQHAQPGSAAGLSTYPAPRIVWIIGGRPASIFLRR